MKLPTQLHRHLAACALLSLCAACQTTETTQTAPPNRFDQADTDHSGCLSRDEVSDMIVSEVFNGRDANKDGKLTKAEWDVPGDAKWNEVFRSADVNHDGVVTRAEAEAYGEKKKLGNDLFKGSDKNKNGCVDREEVRAYYASKEGPAR
jgi:Ca2+-binding EF-hand superfamily protein